MIPSVIVEMRVLEFMYAVLAHTVRVAVLVGVMNLEEMVVADLVETRVLLLRSQEVPLLNSQEVLLLNSQEVLLLRNQQVPLLKTQGVPLLIKNNYESILCKMILF